MDSSGGSLEEHKTPRVEGLFDFGRNLRRLKQVIKKKFKPMLLVIG